MIPPPIWKEYAKVNNRAQPILSFLKNASPFYGESNRWWDNFVLELKI